MKVYLILSIHKESYENPITSIVGIANTKEEKDKLVLKQESWKVLDAKDVGSTCVEYYQIGLTSYSETTLEVHTVPLNQPINI